MDLSEADRGRIDHGAVAADCSGPFQLAQPSVARRHTQPDPPFALEARNAAAWFAYFAASAYWAALVPATSATLLAGTLATMPARRGQAKARPAARRRGESHSGQSGGKVAALRRNAARRDEPAIGSATEGG